MPDTQKPDETHEHSHAQNRFAVIPTAEKLRASSDFSGRGVTIAFLDSGFYPHADIAGRIIAFHDVTGEEGSMDEARSPKGHHWHGTQTVVSCAGDGKLSNGVYRGIAYSADLVLVKVSESGRVCDATIEKGLRWVIENRVKYDIRILNLSVGGDEDLPTLESPLNRLTEILVASGVVVTVAAGNSSASRSIPPANAPSVIAVGGYSDENQLVADNFDLYDSNFGATADGLVKPEIIAPAMYVAAPILPETEDYRLAEKLSLIANSPDYLFRQTFFDNWRDLGLPEYILSTDVSTARDFVEQEMIRRKIISTHYRHVDGTSFAAPITASVAAQMLEANSELTPAAVKNILISTAIKLSGYPSIRQGYGVLNAGLAVEKAVTEQHSLNENNYFPPRVKGKRILFAFHDDDAQSVALSGDFNGWRCDDVMFKQTDYGLWEAEIPCQPPGEYRYKFFIDGEKWIEDPSHGLKTDDGYGGFNSILKVQ